MRQVDGVHIETATPTPIIQENIIASKTRNISPINDLPEWREGTPIAIVGGGPSLKDNLEALRKYEYIIACGSVHDYLIANKITPNYCAIVDPDPVVNNYLQRRNSFTRYLIASQCSPRTFDFLRSYNCNVWHAGGNDSLYKEGDLVIGGGCTIGTRSMVIAMAFGFRDLHLFGMDTCLSEDGRHHSYDFTDESETIGKVHEIALNGPDGRKFKVAEYMFGQIFDFKNILQTCANRVKFTVHGGGVLAYMLEIAKKEYDAYIESMKSLEKT